MATIEELIDRSTRLIQRFDSMQIRGTGWSGNARDGFEFRPEPEEVPATVEGVSGVPPPPPTAACCYSDGTCDNLTFADCTSALGNWMGSDTNCSIAGLCLGACCDDDNNCTLTTPEGCIGTYHGAGTPCEPNPCIKGACCDAGDCSELNATDCAALERTYMGDNTHCTALTCGCPCGFLAFDGSGARFLRYHRSITGNFTVHEPGCPSPALDVSGSCSADFEQHYESDGVGGCHLIIDHDTSTSSRSDGCSFASLECFCNVVIPEHNQCTSFFDYCQCGELSPTPSVSTTVETKTTSYNLAEKSCHGTCFPSGSRDCTWSGSYIVTETLSEPCIPI